MSRTTAEIVARIAEVYDFFGTQKSDLVYYLPFEEAKPYLTEGTSAAQWTPNDPSPEAVKEVIRNYMEFAWDKANNCRGLSAARSILHMQAWVWMLNEDPAWVASLDLDDYRYYGKPQLRAICERLGFDWKAWDDGDWRNSEEGDSYDADQIPLVGVPA